MALLLAVASRARAEDRPLRFVHLSVDDGLAQSSVTRIVQDRTGFLWFATEEGLSRFDGYRFVNHLAREQPGFLVDDNVTDLAHDARGDLWVGTSTGLFRLDLGTSRFQLAGGPAVARLAIDDVAVDAAGRIWFSAETSGLFVLDDARHEARRVAAGALDVESRVDALATDGPGAWVASGGRLLRVLPRGAGLSVTELLHGLGEVSVLAARQGGTVWIGRPEGDLLRYESTTAAVTHYAGVPHGVLALLSSADGTLWIGARDGGLTRLDPTTGAVANHRHDPADPWSLGEDDVDALYEDATGNLWIGTWNGGVDMLDPYAQAFRTFDHRPTVAGSLPDDDVIAMTETDDGQLWLGSRNGVLAAGDPGADRWVGLPPLTPRGRINALAHDGREVFAGTPHGLAILDIASHRERPLSPAMQRAGLDTRPISELQIGPGGELWARSAGEILRVPAAARQPDSTAPAIDVIRPQLPSPVATFLLTEAGRLWVAAETGEIVVAERTLPGEQPELRPFVPSGAQRPFVATSFVVSLLEDAGTFWVGTRQGLAGVRLADGDIRWLGRQGDLPSGGLSGVLPGVDGGIWFATNRGLTRLDPRTGAKHHFGSREGAQGAGYAERAFARGASGRLYFAGHGVTAFDPRDIRVDPHPPSIVFTALEILHHDARPQWRDPGSPLDRELPATSAITLSPEDNTFSVEMAALHFGDPRHNAFAYRLEGFDRSWVRTDVQRGVATYTRLAPGDYLLRARAVTKNGIWSTRDATLHIRVLPPWWRSSPALLGWTVLGLLALAGVLAETRRRTRVRVALMERETLRRASITDPLTGLYNRRFMVTYLQHEVPAALRAVETGKPLASAGMTFFLVDLDHFKSVNDRFSHRVGDRVLCTAAHALLGQIRESDLAIRWGGDEFLVIARSFDREHAGMAAERLRVAIERLSASGDLPPITASIGWAAFPFLPGDPRSLSWEQTLDLADRALLLTKRRQRNGHTGLVTTAAVSARTVADLLAGDARAALPAGIAMVTTAEPVLSYHSQ